MRQFEFADLRKHACYHVVEERLAFRLLGPRRHGLNHLVEHERRVRIVGVVAQHLERFDAHWQNPKNWHGAVLLVAQIVSVLNRVRCDAVAPNLELVIGVQVAQPVGDGPHLLFPLPNRGGIHEADDEARQLDHVGRLALAQARVRVDGALAQEVERALLKLLPLAVVDNRREGGHRRARRLAAARGIQVELDHRQLVRR